MKKILITLLILFVAAFLGYKYIYQSHRDIQNETADYTVKASDMAVEFAKNQEEASKKYLNKTIVVEGKLTEIEPNAITLDQVAYCTLGDSTSNTSQYQKGNMLKVKGRCIGYDELLEIIKLDQASVLQ